jgi:hypothetical protein
LRPRTGWRCRDDRGARALRDPEAAKAKAAAEAEQTARAAAERARADDGRTVATPDASPTASPTGRERAEERAPRRTPAAVSKKILDDAKRSYTEAFQAFMFGDRARAKALAQACLKSAEYPPCHSLLGRVYDQENNVRALLFHYKQYLELVPNAPDAYKVREIIANAEKSR